MGSSPYTRLVLLGRRRRLKARQADDDVRRLRRRVKRLEARVERLDQTLERRIANLEEGLREQRVLGQRVTDLGDVVAAMLGAAARGDQAEFEAALKRYSDGL